MTPVSTVNTQVAAQRNVFVDAPSGKPAAVRIVSSTIGQEKQKSEAKTESTLSSLVGQLLKEEFKLSAIPSSRRTPEQRQQFALDEFPKKGDAARMSYVIASLTEHADEQDIAKAVALLESTAGKGPDAVVAAFRQVKEILWSPKIDQIISQASTLLATPKNGWAGHHFNVNRLMSGLAAVDRADIQKHAEKALPVTEPQSAERGQAVALYHMLREQVFFSVDDRSRVEDVKTFLAEHASEGLSALQEAAEQLRRPQLDQMVRDAGSIFGERSYAELSPVEKRFARMVTHLQDSGLSWAAAVKDLVVPQFIRPEDRQA